VEVRTITQYVEEGGTLNERTVPLMEEPPFYKAELTIQVPYTKVYAFGDDTTLTEKSGKIEVVCNRTHEAILFER